MTTPIDTTRLRALAEKATPGPWAWFGDLASHRIYLATVKGGRRFIMDFRRWGMSGAQPRFQVSGIMRAAKELATREAPYRGDIAEIDHPDARFIAAMNPTTVRALLDEVEGLRARLDEAYPRALQAAAGVVFRYDLSSAVLDMEDEDDVAAAMDALADDILELSAEQIEAFDAKVEREIEPEEGGTP
jgi:hypothetical protein